MDEFETEAFAYDDSDLGNILQDNTFKLPPPRSIENLGRLVSRVEAKENYPKEDMRRLWLKKSSEREKAIKQLRDIDRKLEYWISKRKFTVGVIQDCESSLQKLDIAIMSDITTR